MGYFLVCLIWYNNDYKWVNKDCIDLIFSLCNMYSVVNRKFIWFFDIELVIKLLRYIW